MIVIRGPVFEALCSVIQQRNSRISSNGYMWASSAELARTHKSKHELFPPRLALRSI